MYRSSDAEMYRSFDGEGHGMVEFLSVVKCMRRKLDMAALYS